MRKNKGFTLIELMIVIAIIAIIAAIAIPNLMQSRLRANEATAVTCVRNYGTAQVTYQLGGNNTVANNYNDPTGTGGGISDPRGFCDNYRNLFYGNPRTTPVAGGGGEYEADATRNLALISQAHADAWADEPSGVNGPLGGTDVNDGNPVTAGGRGVYQGYYFHEDPDMADAPIANASPLASNYAMVAIPANSSSTGNNMFWMDSENSVLRQGLPSGQPDATTWAGVTGNTPLTSGMRDNWSAL